MSDGAPTRADAAGLDLPPGYRAIALREYKDAMAHAKAIAATDGAGTLVFVRRFDTVEFAVVLEPEEPLGEARRAIYAIMNAVADALARRGMAAQAGQLQMPISPSKLWQLMQG